MKLVLTAACILSLMYTAACFGQTGPGMQEAPFPKPEGTAAEAGLTEENGMYHIEIVVGNRQFPAKLYKNEATEHLMGQLPLTLDMSELNGNEKYHYLSEGLPTDSHRPGQIQSGDLMLFGSDCLVLFYESFTSSYSYTSLGYLEDPVGLKEALGSGNVQVVFQAE